MKNYDLERKIYRYKTITKYQEKAKMLGYQDTSKVVFSFLNKRLLFTFLLFCFVLLFSSYSYLVAPIVSILFYNLYAYFYFDYRIIERGKSLERDAIYFFEVLTLSLESGKTLVQSLKLTTSCIDSELSNEIIYYFHKYGIINVADFISYISDREEILRTLRDIIAMGIKEDFQIEEIEDYIFVINEYHKEERVNNLNKKLKEEKDPLKQAEISMEIMKIRGGSRNGIRN